MTYKSNNISGFNYKLKNIPELVQKYVPIVLDKGCPCPYNKNVTSRPNSRRINKLQQRRLKNISNNVNKFQELHRRGYIPIPVVSGTKKPAIKNWQNANPTKMDMLDWHEQKHSIGILTKNNPVLDLDTLNENFRDIILEFIEKRLGKSIKRIGKAPKIAIICQTDIPFTKMTSKIYWTGKNYDTKNQLEVLGEGQFLVVDGLHPDTGKLYYYIDKHLTDVDSKELVYLSKEQCKYIIDKFNEIGTDYGICREDENKKFHSHKPQTVSNILPGQISPISSYNKQHSIENELKQRGDIQVNNRFQYSKSESGNAGITILEGKMISYHSGDPLSDGHSHDSFDVMQSRLKLSQNEAIIYAAKNSKSPNGKTVYKFNKEIYEKQQLTVTSHTTFKLTRASDLISASTAKQTNWIIKKILGQGHFAVLIGESGIGKTFFGLDISYNIANGFDWQGHKTTQGTVIYIAGEGHYGIRDRVKVLDNTYKGNGNNLIISDSAINMTDSKHVKELSQYINENHPNPVLIVIDTLQRNFGHGDENSTRDMTSFIRNIDTYLKINNTSVLVIHHTGHKDTHRARGSSTLKASADMEYHVKSSGSIITLRNTKAKDSPQFPSLTFQLVSKETGEVDEDGEKITSAVLELTNDVVPDKNAKKKLLSGNNLIVYKALKKALEIHGKPIPDNLEVSTLNNKYVLKEHWNAEVKKMMKGKSSSNPNMPLQRGIPKLLELGKIYEEGDYYTILKN